MLLSQILLALEMRLNNIRARNKTSQLNSKYNLVNIWQSNTVDFNFIYRSPAGFHSM